MTQNAVIVILAAAGTETDKSAMDYVEDIPITHSRKPIIRLNASMNTYSRIQLTVLHIPRDLLDDNNPRHHGQFTVGVYIFLSCNLFV